MNKLARLTLALAVLVLPLVAFAQAPAPPPPGYVGSVATTALAYPDALTELVQLAQTLKGASGLGIAIAIVQGVMLLLRTPLASKLGKWSLTAVIGLSCVVSLLTAKLAGASWLAALLSGPVLAALQVFAHQLIAQFTEKPDDASAAKS